MGGSELTMLSAVEVGNKVSKEDYETALPELRKELVNLQYDLQQADFSVLVLLMGDSRKDINETLDILHEWMDARFLDTRVLFLPQKEECDYPESWRHWRALPARGRIGIHLGGWPVQTLTERVLHGGSRAEFERRIAHQNAFVDCLVADGTVVLKFWLHVPAKEVRKRLKRAKKDPDGDVYVNKRDRQVFDVFHEGMPYVEHMLRKTDTGHAPWELVEATDARYRNLFVAREILSNVRQRLDAPPAPSAAASSADEEPPEPPLGALVQVNLESQLDRAEYRERLEAGQQELNALVRKFRDEISTVLMFEGWDAAGKGGVIRRLTHAMFAQDYRVESIAAPTDEELAHHYLWRFWRRIPRDGQVAIFDRSWYGRVLVERVEGFASEDEWRRAYAEINDFEQQLVEHGTVFCKFWLHIDPDEQLRRFQARETIGYKKYKITDEDYRNRERWDAYTVAVNEMVMRTSPEGAPWHLVPANDKKWARVQVLETVVAAMKKRWKER